MLTELAATCQLASFYFFFKFLLPGQSKQIKLFSSFRVVSIFPNVSLFENSRHFSFSVADQQLSAFVYAVSAAWLRTCLRHLPLSGQRRHVDAEDAETAPPVAKRHNCSLLHHSFEFRKRSRLFKKKKIQFEWKVFLANDLNRRILRINGLRI